MTDDLAYDSRLWYASVTSTTIGYTAFLVIVAVSIRLLWRARGTTKTFGRRALIPFTVVSLLFATALFSLEMVGMESALNAIARGETFQGLVPGFCNPSVVAIDILYHVAVILSDALLVYRTFVIAKNKVYSIIIPGFLIAASTDIKCASSMGQPSTHATERLTMAWLLSSVFLNVVLTTIIIATVWPARTVTAANPAGQRVTPVIGILAESAAGYTLVGLLFIGAIAAGSRWQILLERAFGVTAFVSSSIITLRIALGIEYTPAHETSAPSLLPTHRTGSMTRGMTMKV